MQFNSYSYLLLLLCAVVVFWSLPVRVRRWYVLALSIGFYATWSPQYVLVPLALCGIVFAAARRCVSSPSAGAWFWGGIACSLASLVTFRYQAVFVSSLLALENGLRASPGKTIFQLAVPLGISFYTFEAISYLIDVRQKRITAARFSDLYLFIMFWPHLIAGPIVRFRELASQLSFEKKFELTMLVSGLDRLLWGLVQKNLLADTLARFVDQGFLAQTTGANTWLDNWFLAVAFGLQIYFDFAAYSNMAIGAASLMGVTLPENFRFPYHAKTPAEFWQRWHITLSRWVRDYLFFPVNVRFQGAPFPLYLSLLAIMAVVGLWHGAGLGFLIWGLLQGCFLVAYRWWEAMRQQRGLLAPPSRLAGLFWRAVTLVAVMSAWVPFRADSLGQATGMLRSMFFSFDPRISFSLNFYLLVLLIAIICALEPLIRDGMVRLDALAGRHTGLALANTYLLRPALYALALLLFVIFDERNIQFIYSQF
jgi:alginate O-acetyltransferase complex protein AlgI